LPSSATRSRPIHPRRVSGPARRPLPAGPAVRGRTSAFERIARIPDNRIVDRVLRSRGVIWLIGIMLGGIVAMQVSLLRLNTGISRAVQTTETVSHQNQLLQMQIAELSASGTIREKAADMNMVDPPAGDRRFLTSRGAEKDAKRAAKRIKPPSDLARMIEINRGWMPGPGATIASLLAAQQGTTGTANAQVQATPTPVAPTEPQQPLPTPVPTVAPPATAVPTVDPATGVAPQG
jgi:hypothetical protein